MNRSEMRKYAESIVGRHFRFLLAAAKKETAALISDFISDWNGASGKDFSNALQRSLYKFARERGFRKLRGSGRWTDFPLKSDRRALLRATLRRAHLAWLRYELPCEDYAQEEELFLLENAHVLFIKPFFRAAGRHFYQVAVNYGFKRPKKSSRFIRMEILIDKFPDETADEAMDRRKEEAAEAFESLFKVPLRKRRSRHGVPQKNRAFWTQVRARTTDEEWASLWDWAKKPTFPSAPPVAREVQRRLK